MAKWRPGQSGNPAGRPKGTETKEQFLRKRLLQNSDDIVKLVLTRAREGDMLACKLVLDRVSAPLRAADAPIKLPGLTDATPAEAARAIVAGMGDGILSPSQVPPLLQGLSAFARIIESEDLEQRIRALEHRDNGGLDEHPEN